jgi:hypothetical protein
VTVAKKSTAAKAGMSDRNMWRLMLASFPLIDQIGCANLADFKAISQSKAPTSPVIVDKR